jgi:hypothetical protein
MTEAKDLPYAGRCFHRHRTLAVAALQLHRELATVHADADLFRMGATCMRIAAQNALQTSDPQQMLRSWRECALAERQIRLATFRALRAGCIDNRRYDELFSLARITARTREDERQRIRRKILQMDLV